MTAIMQLRYLMLTLLAAVALGLGGMAHAAGDVTSGDGATGSDAPETIQFEDDEDDEWGEEGDDDWEDDDDDW